MTVSTKVLETILSVQLIEVRAPLSLANPAQMGVVTKYTIKRNPSRNGYTSVIVVGLGVFIIYANRTGVSVNLVGMGINIFLTAKCQNLPFYDHHNLPNGNTICNVMDKFDITGSINDPSTPKTILVTIRMLSRIRSSRFCMS